MDPTNWTGWTNWMNWIPCWRLGSAVQYVALTTPRTWTGRRTVVGLVRGKKREKKKNFFKGLFAPKNSYNFVD
jgi:hypothetical protein